MLEETHYFAVGFKVFICYFGRPHSVESAGAAREDIDCALVVTG